MKDIVYLVYISVPKDVFDSRFKYLVEDVHSYRFDNDMWHGLYAWSYKKKHVNEFLKLRNKEIYTVVKKDISDNDEIHSMLKHKYSNLKISEYDYIMNSKLKREDIISYSELSDEEKDNIVLIYTTKNEYITCTEYLRENLFEFIPIPTIPYDYFSGELVNELDILQYVYWYDITAPCSDLEAASMRYDNAGYSASYGLTPLGHKLYAEMVSNELYGLFYLYSYPFLGKEGK